MKKLPCCMYERGLILLFSFIMLGVVIFLIWKAQEMWNWIDLFFPYAEDEETRQEKEAEEERKAEESRRFVLDKDDFSILVGNVEDDDTDLSN